MLDVLIGSAIKIPIAFNLIVGLIVLIVLELIKFGMQTLIVTKNGNVEWSPGVVAIGLAYLFLSLSVDSASLAQAILYLQDPLIKPYVQFSRIRLSNHLHPQAFAVFQGAVVGILYSPSSW